MKTILPFLTDSRAPGHKAKAFLTLAGRKLLWSIVLFLATGCGSLVSGWWASPVGGTSDLDVLVPRCMERVDVRDSDGRWKEISMMNEFCANEAGYAKFSGRTAATLNYCRSEPGRLAGAEYERSHDKLRITSGAGVARPYPGGRTIHVRETGSASPEYWCLRRFCEQVGDLPTHFSCSEATLKAYRSSKEGAGIRDSRGEAAVRWDSRN